MLTECLFAFFNLILGSESQAMITASGKSNILIYKTCSIYIENNERHGIFIHCGQDCEKLNMKDTSIEKCGAKKNEYGVSNIYWKRRIYDRESRFLLDRMNMTSNNAQGAPTFDIRYADGEVKHSTFLKNYAPKYSISYIEGCSFKISHVNFIDNEVGKLSRNRYIFSNYLGTETTILEDVYISDFDGTAIEGNNKLVSVPESSLQNLKHLRSFYCRAKNPINYEDERHEEETVHEIDEPTDNKTKKKIKSKSRRRERNNSALWIICYLPYIEA